MFAEMGNTTVYSQTCRHPDLHKQCCQFHYTISYLQMEECTDCSSHGTLGSDDRLIQRRLS